MFDPSILNLNPKNRGIQLLGRRCCAIKASLYCENESIIFKRDTPFVVINNFIFQYFLIENPSRFTRIYKIMRSHSVY